MSEMFKWPGFPSSRAPDHELADYVELVCWQQGTYSVTALEKELGRLEENDYSGGVPEDEEVQTKAGEAFQAIERRMAACDDGYPFAMVDRGHALRDEDARNPKHDVYRYLLLATRLNMKTKRVHADIDGTLLFEELAAEAAKRYIGFGAESFVFGTAGDVGYFRARVDVLCRKIGEGRRFMNRTGNSPNERDGKLDIVIWKHFADKRPGKLIAFGQCKTGTSYQDTLAHLQPDAFCDKWLHTSPSLMPIRMFCVAEALPQQDWYNLSRDAGLLLDRCRLVSCCVDVGESVMERVVRWTAAAASATELR